MEDVIRFRHRRIRQCHSVHCTICTVYVLYTVYSHGLLDFLLVVHGTVLLYNVQYSTVHIVCTVYVRTVHLCTVRTVHFVSVPYSVQ